MYIFYPRYHQILRTAHIAKAFNNDHVDEFCEWCENNIEPVDGLTASGDSNVKRRSELRWLTYNPDEPIIRDWFNAIAVGINRINSEIYRFDLNGMFEPIQYTIYYGSNKGHYDYHIDSHSGTEEELNGVINEGLMTVQSSVRKLSATILLSEPEIDFKGGDFLVKSNLMDETKPEIGKGSILCFPSFMPHAVKPVTEGIRKSLVVWVSGPQFR